MNTSPQILELAMSRHREGKLQEAERLYRQLLTRDPRDVNALHLLGILASQMNRHELAIGFIEKAISIAPSFAVFHTNLGSSKRSAGRPHEAIECFERALQLDPGNSGTLCQIGHVHKQLGERSKAVAHYRQALEHNSGWAEAYKGISDLAPPGASAFSPGELDYMRAMLAQEALADRDRSLFAFALADHLDRESKYEEAFRWYQVANQSAREVGRVSGQVFDQQTHEGRIESIIRVFDKTFLSEGRESGIATERPVFVVGMLRSGTTLVEQILASHPQVFGAGELRLISTIAAELPNEVSGARPFPDGVADLAGTDEARLASGYLKQIDAFDSEAARVIDKMPSNYLYLGLVSRLFPEARVIQCLREPRDVCLSCYTNNLRDPWTNQLDDLGAYYLQYEKLMAHWRNVLPLPFHEVVYEDLVANPESVSRGLVDFCGLDWDDGCLRFHQNPRPVLTASVTQVRRPVYTSSVGNWENYAGQLKPLSDALTTKNGM